MSNSAGEYTAIMVAMNGTETYTASREVSSDDPKVVAGLFVIACNVTLEEIDTILLMQNGNPTPVVVQCWRWEEWLNDRDTPPIGSAV